MLTYALLTMFVLFFSVYVWKDWYKTLCALIIMMAVVGHGSMPRAMFGITGLNLFNLLMFLVLMAWLVAKKREQLQWDMPSKLNKLLLLYLFIVIIGIIRYATNIDVVLAYSDEIGWPFPTVEETFIDRLINSFKWTLPGLLLFIGCNSRERFKWGVVSLILLYLILAILVIRWMPLGLLVDGEALQRRAARVLGRELGYYRTNLSVMLAGAFWMILNAKYFFGKKHLLLFYGMAGICFLAMFLTGGRGGILAWVVVGTIVSFVKYRKYIILAPPLVALVLINVPSVQDRLMMGFGDSAEVDESNLGTISAGRTILWPLILDEVAEKPLFGYGYWGIITSGVSVESYLNTGFAYSHPHNAYLQTLIDNGVIGSLPILLFYLLVVKYAWSLFRDNRSDIYVLAGGTAFVVVVSVLVASFTGQSFYPEERSVGLWCAIGLMLRVYVDRLNSNHLIKGHTGEKDAKIYREQWTT